MNAPLHKPSWLRLLVRAARSSAERQDLIWELRRRRGGEPAMPPGELGTVLVVCHGNICRSPFAELHLAACCPRLEIRSAGLEAAEGDPAQPGALRVGPEFGVDLSGHASHHLSKEDIDWADLIIGMTGRHQTSIRRRWPAATPKTRLLGDYLPDAPYGIEDPWGQHDDLFRIVFRRIVLANERIAALIESH